MIETILDRAKTRLTGETYNNAVLEDTVQTVIDRLCLRIGVSEVVFPSILYSIAVDASIKAYRRRYYEGISQESVANISTHFIDDILAEYEDDLTAWLESDEAADISSNYKVVRFL